MNSFKIKIIVAALLSFVSIKCMSQNESSTGIIVNYKKISYGDIEIKITVIDQLKNNSEIKVSIDDTFLSYEDLSFFSLNTFLENRLNMEGVTNTIYKVPMSTYNEELYITLKNKTYFGKLITLTILPGEEKFIMFRH